MATFLDMVTRITDEVDDAGIDAQIRKAILSAIKHYERTKFYFNQTTFTFSTVAGQEFYAAAAAANIETFLEIYSSYVTFNGVRTPFYPIPYEIMDAAQTGQVTGDPITNWSYFGQQIRVYPIPSQVYVATIAGHYRIATIAADGTTNAWTDDAEELIRQRAKRILAIDVTKEPSDALAAQSLEQDALEALLYETQLRRGRPLAQIDPALLGGHGSSNINTGDL